MQDELIDRFGDPPKAVLNLLATAVLKASARKIFITEIKHDGDRIRIEISEKARLASENIPELLKLHEGRLRLIARGIPYFLYTPGEITYRKKGLLDEMQMLADSMVRLLSLQEINRD